MKGRPRQYGQPYQQGPYKGQMQIDSVRVSKTTASKPSLADDEIAFRLDIDIDADIFLDPTGTIKVQIDNPSGQQGASNIVAKVDPPIRGRAQSPAAAAIGGNNP